MRFLNDTRDHEWSYCCLMCHVYALEPEELTAEMRETIARAAEKISVQLRGCFVYESNAEDDVDAFVLLTPGGYVLVLSSELAKCDLETMNIIFEEVDQDTLKFGPETQLDVPSLNEKAQKRAQETREPVGGDNPLAELEPSLEDIQAAARAEIQADIDALEAEGKAELDRACEEIHADLEAAFAPAQREFEELRKHLDKELKL